MVDQVLPVRVPLLGGDAVLVAEPPHRLGLHAGQCDQVDARFAVVGRHVLPAGPAQTDHARAQGLNRFLGGRICEGHSATPSPLSWPLVNGAGWLTTWGGANVVPVGAAAQRTALARTRWMSGWW